MGFFDRYIPKVITVQSILPPAAVNEIRIGRLPVLNTNRILLKSGEKCHYIDKAIYEKKIIRKRYIRKNTGYSMPGLFKGTRVRFGNGRTDEVDNIQYEKNRGILYLTNQRLIFQGEFGGFCIKLDDIIAVAPYANCIDIQCNRENYRLFVPDGNIIHSALQLIR